MKILVAGDTHAHTSSIQVLDLFAREHDVDEIWQCGDLGWWPRASWASTFIHKLSSLPVPVYFADGNHEDHERLDHDALEPYEITPNVWHVPRGAVRTVHGRQIMFFGGARSVDRLYRMPGVTWFHQELPSPQQWDRAFAEDKVDIVIAHDTPHWVDYGYLPPREGPWPTVDLMVSEEFRKTVTHLAKHLQPRLWFNGHHHKRLIAEQDGIQVQSLGESLQEPSKWCVVLDLETLEVIPV